MEPNPLIPLPIVLGPTASGKSALAIRMAAELGGEIVNCDSLQVYRGFDIGTAKVTEAARGGIPHHLIDFVDTTELFSAGDYAVAARAVLGQIAARHRLPIVVGGTGFYLRALLNGLFAGPARDESTRARLESREIERPGSLHRILQRLDPKAASRIHANDTSKIIRALEVRLLVGRPISDLFGRSEQALAGYQPIKLGLSPAHRLLYQRLDARTIGIFERGLLDEVRRLLAAGVPRSAKPFESLGYKEALQVLDGRMTVEQAVASTQLETRRYAKRQMTWFRKEAGVHWLEGFGDDPEIQTQAIALVRAEMKNNV